LSRFKTFRLEEELQNKQEMKTGSGEQLPIFVVDDDADLCLLVERWLEKDGRTVLTYTSGESCLRGLTFEMAGVICLDLNMPGMGGLETLKRVKAHHPHLPVIVLTADDSADSAVSAMKLGAFDYLTKPLDRNKLMATVSNALQRHSLEMKVVHLEREASGSGYHGIVGQAPSMKELFRRLDRLASSDVTALVYGESGTGKELIARAIHVESSRRDGPFVAVNCAAIPENLVESELFGHEKGAFTGATDRRVGKFEQADGGTLFLDEIGELNPQSQAKLLRVLQERVFERVGGSALIDSDFRLLAATHRVLSADVKDGKFREDLYFRVAVFELDVPPLRERVEDLILLAKHFVSEAKASVGISEEAALMMRQYHWPGNVRELQNAIQRAIVLADEAVIMPQDLPPRLREDRTSGELPRLSQGTDSTNSLPSRPGSVPEVPQSFHEIEGKAIEDALNRSEGNLSQMMRELDISRTRLYRMLKKHNLMDRVGHLRGMADELRQD
jgi:DNA-binding NtrC family response regulator